MTESEIEELVNRRLTEAGVAGILDRDRSQFLEVPPGLFTEIVLVDASKQPDAERVLKNIVAELQRGGTTLEYVLRSLWRVGEIRYAGPARALEGGLRFALDFRVQLLSGRRQIEVEVDVTMAALTILRQKLGIDDWVMNIGWSPQKGDVQEENIRAAVATFLEVQLSQGGMSYWDPLLHSRLELDEAAMSYVLGHSTAFRELHTAITDAFSETVVNSFLESLYASGLRLVDFDNTLSELSNMLGGAYRRGQTFSVSAVELFNSLGPGERRLIKEYFLISAKKLRERHPEFAAQFQQVFENLPEIQHR